MNQEDHPVDDDKNSLKTVFHALESCDTFDTFLMLSELKPSYIILYDCDMTFVRQVCFYAFYNKQGGHCMLHNVLLMILLANFTGAK